MREYNPDKYVMVRVKELESGEIHYRVMGTWYGGYASGDYYRLNSGIERYEETDEGVLKFYGGSGSLYEAHKESEGGSLYSLAWLGDLTERAKKSQEIEIISFKEFVDEWNT